MRLFSRGFCSYTLLAFCEKFTLFPVLFRLVLFIYLDEWSFDPIQPRWIWHLYSQTQGTFFFSIFLLSGAEDTRRLLRRSCDLQSRPLFSRKLMRRNGGFNINKVAGERPPFLSSFGFWKKVFLAQIVRHSCANAFH